MLGKNPEHGIARATSKIMNSIKKSKDNFKNNE